MARITGPMALALVFLLAGCAAPAAPEPANVDAAAAKADAEPVVTVPGPAASAAPRVVATAITQAQGCREGGGHTLYDMDSQGGPSFLDVWTRADVKPRTGAAVVGSYGLPMPGAATGIYHATVFCDAYAFQGAQRQNLVWGFVVTQVEPPPFDTGGADIHYLASQMLVNDPDLQAQLVADGSVHAMPGGGVVEYGLAGPDLLRTTYDGGEMHGVFETQARMVETRDVTTETVRVWFLVTGADKLFHPVALDMRTTGGTFHNVAGGATGTFTHTMSGGAHGAAPVLAATVGGIYLDGFDRVFEWGPRPAVTTNEVWEH